MHLYTIGRLVQPFAGLIDEVQIYPYALSAANINNYYLSTKDGLSTSSLFYPAGIAAPGPNLDLHCDSKRFLRRWAFSIQQARYNYAPMLHLLHQVCRYPQYVLVLLDWTEKPWVLITSIRQADGLAELGSQIRWYMNGALQAGLNDQLSVPASTTQIGQTWYFTVIPGDFRRSSWRYADISNSYDSRQHCPSTGVPTLDSTNGGTDYDDEDLVATTAAATTDADTDAYHEHFPLDKEWCFAD